MRNTTFNRIVWFLIVLVFVFLTLKANITVALLCLSISLGVISISMLLNKYRVVLSRQLFGTALLTSCLSAAILGGIEYFAGSILVSLILWGIFWLIFRQQRPPVKVRSVVSRQADLPSVQFSKKQPKPYFAGKGSHLDVGGYLLQDPMIYVVDSREYGDFDASLLCLKRTISPPRKDQAQTLPYWPRLSDCEPHQVAHYLHWLQDGRNDPNIELGYVFIYFYGLERRALVDRKDILEIGNEVLRLLKIYGSTRSFRQYATGMFIHLIMLGLLRPTEKIMDALLQFQQGYVSDTLREMILGVLANHNQVLPAKWAIHFARQDERSRRSVVVDRAEEEFGKLFQTRYDSQLKGKMVPQKGSGLQKIRYQAASPSLGRGNDLVSDAEWTKIIGWKGQFAPVVQLYNDCIEELRSYTRKVSSQEPSIAFEYLPPDLQKELKHPQQAQWDHLLEAYSGKSRVCLLPVGKVASIRGLECKQRLPLGQAKSLAQFVESLGSSMEPDPRYTQKTLQWEESVSILHLPDKPYQPQGPGYQLTGFLLPLALEVSEAEGEMDEAERRVINDFFQERFMLSRNDCLRLDALIEVIRQNGISLAGIKKKITTLFNETQRKAIGRFLVMIAGAVNGICTKELKSLEKAIGYLSLEKEVLSGLIQELGYSIPEESRLVVKGKTETGAEIIPPRQVVLDLDKIRQIHQESIEASRMLLDAMSAKSEGTSIFSSSVEHSDGNGQTLVMNNENGNSIATMLISRNVKPFYTELITKTEWPRSDLYSLAQKHNVTVSAAIEEINGWSDETLGDFLVEEGDTTVIRRELLAQMGDNYGN